MAVSDRLQEYKTRALLKKYGYDALNYFSSAILDVVGADVQISSKCYYYETLPQQAKTEINKAISDYNRALLTYASMCKYESESVRERNLFSYCDEMKTTYLLRIENKFGVKLYDKDVVVPFLQTKKDEILAKAKAEEEGKTI